MSLYNDLSSLLTRHRSAVFDPCFGTGELLRATHNGPLVRLYGLDADPSNRSASIRSIIGPIHETWPLLRAVNAQFDLVVCAPPQSTWPAKNLPAPPPRPGAQFGLGQRRAISIDAEMHAVQAAWLMMNSALSPLGEGLLVAPESLARQFIVPCAWARRIWLWVQLPGGTAAVYFAADHRGGASFVTQVFSNELIAESQRMRKKLIRGETITTDFDNQADVERRFEGARHEWQRIANPESPQFNLWLRNGKLAFHVSAFQEQSGDVPRDIIIDGARINGRPPIDLMALKDERQLLERLITDKRLRVHPEMPRIYEETLAEYAHASAPFSRPSAIQRVAWLDEHEQVKCRRSWESFEAGQSYAVSSCIFEGQRKENRQRAGHGIEEVMVTGQELMMVLIDSAGRSHAFTQHPLSKDEQAKRSHIRAFHSLLELTRNFELPDVPDIVAADPDTYREMMRRLEALETA